jgi:hypothetical protein
MSVSACEVVWFTRARKIPFERWFESKGQISQGGDSPSVLGPLGAMSRLSANPSME